MYLDFFKFKKSPFHITPDPDFLFLSPSHKEASASIYYGIEERKGFVAVTGEVGVGKTTILRSYLEGTDPEKTRIVYIFNAAISFDKLLKQIASEFGIPVAGVDSAELVDSLFHYLIQEYENDRNVVLIIDEAQNMPVETLERLRMLSNLETSQDKLLQIILVGQPEFEDKLNRPELRQLKQRIAIMCRVSALTPEESLAYIQHRLMKASQFHNQVFTKDALKRIVKEANGIPRIINVLCDNVLITAFGYQRNPVDGKIVKEVIKDFKGQDRSASFNWKIVWVPALVLAFGLAALAWSGLVTPKEITTLIAGSLSSIITERTPVETRIKLPEVKHPIVNAPGPEQSPAVAEARPPVESAPKAEQGKHVAEAKPPVESAPKAEQEQHVAEVNPPVESAPKVEQAPAVSEVKPVAENPPKMQVGRAMSDLPASGGEASVSKTRAQSPVASAQPSVLAMPEPRIKDQPPGGNLSVFVVKKGDSVSKLLMDAYGRVDDDLLRSFRELNPQITNINRIREGEELTLPKAQKN